jgi:hypothetical protein
VGPALDELLLLKRDQKVFADSEHRERILLEDVIDLGKIHLMLLQESLLQLIQVEH